MKWDCHTVEGGRNVHLMIFLMENEKCTFLLANIYGTFINQTLIHTIFIF